MIFVDDRDFTLHVGDALEVLQTMPAESVHCVVTSPPYWGLRNYSVDGQLGLEATPQEFVTNLVGVMREVRRVLRDDGTLWLNLGDSYASQGGHQQTDKELADEQAKGWFGDERGRYPTRATKSGCAANTAVAGLKPKDLVGVPWRVAFALQEDGWYLRSDIIWAKPNPMPESVTDRPTKAHEYVFLLTKSPRYFFDAEAIREPHTAGNLQRQFTQPKDRGDARTMRFAVTERYLNPAGRNARSVWEIAEQETLDPSLPPEKPRGPDGRRKTTVTGGEGSLQHRDGERWPSEGPNVRSVWHIATQPYPEAHFATYPEELVRRCILAGTSERGCCPVCGAPWVRETAVEYRALGDPERQNRERLADQRVNHRNYDAEIHGGPQAMTHGRAEKSVTTTGWAPSCTHNLEPVPSVILDPFMGSGTTALVARKHGRCSIGIELSPEYAALAAKRLGQQSLFTEVA